MSTSKQRYRRARRRLFADIRLRAELIADCNIIIRYTHKDPFAMTDHAVAWKMKRIAEAWLR